MNLGSHLWKDCRLTKFSLTCSCICFCVRPLYLSLWSASGLDLKCRSNEWFSPERGSATYYSRLFSAHCVWRVRASGGIHIFHSSSISLFKIWYFSATLQLFRFVKIRYFHRWCIQIFNKAKVSGPRKHFKTSRQQYLEIPSLCLIPKWTRLNKNSWHWQIFCSHFQKGSNENGGSGKFLWNEGGDCDKT